MATTHNNTEPMTWRVLAGSITRRSRRHVLMRRLQPVVSEVQVGPRPRSGGASALRRRLPARATATIWSSARLDPPGWSPSGCGRAPAHGHLSEVRKSDGLGTTQNAFLHPAVIAAQE